MSSYVKPAASVQSEENNPILRDAKAAAALKPPCGRQEGQSLLAQNSKRRALGDIGNLVAPVNRPAGKDGKDASNAILKPRSASTSRPKVESGAPQAQAVDAANNRPTSAMARITRSQTRAQGGMSMSSLLQTRSEAAVSAAQAASPTSPLPDIDSHDRHNPLAATEYVNDIYSYYRRIEPKLKVSHSYMSKQVDINEKMRSILVDWLVDVHLKFKLLPETLFLTVNLIDRYLEVEQVTRRNLQLVGVTAMLVASKYEEIWAPEVRDFVYISDKAYTREQILDMEKSMLNTLRFNLTLPTAYNFQARYLKAASSQTDKQLALLSSYLIELCLPDYASLKFSYSMIATAAIYVAARALGRADPFPKAFMRHSTYTVEAILPCAAHIVTLMQKAPANTTMAAVYKKYSNPKFMEVATKTEVPMAILADAAGEA